MNTRKRKIIAILAVIFTLAFLSYNLFWYFFIYRPFQIDYKLMPEVENSGINIYTDEDGFEYSIHKPSYMLNNGNYAISNLDMSVVLIIWKDVCKNKYTTGVIVSDSTGQHQIEIDNNGNPINAINQDIINENKHDINILIMKANNYWRMDI